MAKFKLTRFSEADLVVILEYTLTTWGQKQAERYLGSLHACFQELADLPGLGRNCGSTHPGLKRMENGRHVIFYRTKDYGIRVIRVLHQGMMPDRNILDEE